MTNDMSEYFSDKDRIKELEAQLSEAEDIIIKERRLKSKYKIKCEKLSGNRPLTKGQKATIMIKKVQGTGERKVLIAIIARELFMSVGAVRALWYKELNAKTPS